MIDRLIPRIPQASVGSYKQSQNTDGKSSMNSRRQKKD